MAFRAVLPRRGCRAIVAAAVLAAACSTFGIAGTYEGDLPAGSAGGERHVSVTLADDGGAALASEFSGRPSRLLVKGTWTRSGDAVAVKLDNGEPLVFSYAEGRLVAKEWDRTLWGEMGPGTLTRR